MNKFITSIVILLVLVYSREAVTPDFIHFIMSVVDDEAHYICVMYYWLFWKCFLLEDYNIVNLKADEERKKIVVRSALELVIALILSTVLGFSQGVWPFVYSFGVFSFAAIRSIYYEQLDLNMKIFLAIYFS